MVMGMIPIAAITSIVTFARSSRTGHDTARIEAARVQARELRCLAENVYYEARGESLDGQYAVAEVTMNRVKSPLYAKTICEVVFDTRWDPIRRRYVGHFSWTELQDRPDPWGPPWEQAVKVATAVYNGSHMPLVPDALHYHASSVHPYWAESRRVVATIDHHIFYP